MTTTRLHATDREQSRPFRMRALERLFSKSPVAFDLVCPDGTVRRFGSGPAEFRVLVKSDRAFKALLSFDEGRIADSFVEGELDLDGDMLQPFRLRRTMKDFHPLTRAWRFVQPLLFGQVHTNRQAISSHYDIDSEFFLSFLDPEVPCYTQGIYDSPDEPLKQATLRKFAYCFEKCELKPGDRILEIGPGWGAWFEYASQRGVDCTGITISRESVDFLNARAARLGYEWEIMNVDLLEFQEDRKFDAIVIMGVIEHLPQYDRVLSKFAQLLKPGGRVFLDGSACRRKFELSSFMVKYIYGGNHSFLVLHDFLTHLAKTPFELLELHNDRISYIHTFVQWAKNFDANREHVIGRFGLSNFQRFRLYLWGAAYDFLVRGVECYRLILRLPGESDEEYGTLGRG